MPLPWETPVAQPGAVKLPWETGPAAIPKLPWEQDPTPDIPDLPPPPEETPAPEQEEGFLSKLGYVLDTPGAYTRGLLAGEPGERVSGQHLLENWGLADKGEEPAGLLSAKGLGGLAAEVVLDPINLLPGALGIKALTRGGRAAELVGSHLGTAKKLAEGITATTEKAAQVAKAARRFEEAEAALKTGAAHPDVVTDLLQGARNIAPRVEPEALAAVEKAIEDAKAAAAASPYGNVFGSPEEIVKNLASQPGELGDAAQAILSNPRGFYPTLASEAGERVKQGQEAFLSVGGPTPIVPLPWLAHKTTANLPQVTLLEAPRAAQALQDVGRMIGKAPPFAQLGKLFKPSEAEAAGRDVLREAEATRDVAKSKLKQATEAMQAGNEEEAVKLYEEALGDINPPGSPGMDELVAGAGRTEPLAEAPPTAPAAGVPSTPFFEPRGYNPRAYIESRMGHAPVAKTGIDVNLLDGEEYAKSSLEGFQKHRAEINPKADAVSVMVDNINQKGANSFYKENLLETDKHVFGPAVRIMREELLKVPDVSVETIKVGADEWMNLVHSEGPIDREAVAQAAERAKARTLEHVQGEGIPLDLENPRAKKPDPEAFRLDTPKGRAIFEKAQREYLQGRGTGVRVAVQGIGPADTYQSIWKGAAEQFEAEKRAAYGERRTAQEAGALPFEGQAARTARGIESPHQEAPAAIPEAFPPGPGPALGAAEAVAKVPFTITRDARQQLYDLGLSKATVDAMKPEVAQEILSKGKIPETLPWEQTAKEIPHAEGIGGEVAAPGAGHGVLEGEAGGIRVRNPAQDRLAARTGEAARQEVAAAPRMPKLRTNAELAQVPDEVLADEARNMLGEHVSGLKMGAKEFAGTYISTEPSRYATAGRIAQQAVVNVKNPKIFRSPEEFNSFSNKYLPKQYASVEHIPPWEFTRVHEEMGLKATEELRREGFDSVYLPATEFAEGILVAFDRANVRIGGATSEAARVGWLASAEKIEQARQEVAAAGVKDPEKIVPKGMAFNAAQAAVRLIKTLRSFSQEELPAFLRGVEHGGEIPEHMLQPVKDWHELHDAMIDYEAKVAGAVKLESERGLGYAAHVATPEGLQALKGGKAKAFFEALKAKAEELEVKLTAREGEEAGRLAKLDPEIQKLVQESGLSDQYLARSFHPSMLARTIRELGVGEINDVAREVLGKPLFHEDPALLLHERVARHLNTRVQGDFLQGIMDKGVGREVAEIRGKPLAEAPGIERIKEGYTVPILNATRPGKAVAFGSLEEAQVAQRIYSKLTSPKEASELLNWYDNATRTMKGFVTRMFPAFHFRNRYLGNRIQAWLFDDVPYAGAHYGIGQKIVKGDEVAVKVGKQTLNAQQIEDLWLKNGGQRGGFFQDLADEVSQEAKAGGLKGKSLNPLEANNIYFAVGQKAADIGEAVAAPIAQLPSGLHLKATGQSIEQADRLGAFVYFLQHGQTPQEAVRKTYHALFDYSKKNMTEFEREYMNRLVFFYGYVRNVIPRVLETALTNTRKLAPFAHLSQQPGKPEYAPPWATEGIEVPLGEDEQGRTRVVSNIGTPVEAAAEPFLGFQQGLGRGLAKLGASLNPIVKTPIELATGKDLFLGKDIEDLRKAPHWVENLSPEVQKALGVQTIKTKTGVRYEMDPDVLYALRNSPLARVSSTLSRGADESKSGADRLLNVLTGANIVTIDSEREKALKVRDAIVAKLKDLERQGRVKEIPNLFGLADKGDTEAKGLIRELRPRKAAAH